MAHWETISTVVEFFGENSLTDKLSVLISFEFELEVFLVLCMHVTLFHLIPITVSITQKYLRGEGGVLCTMMAV